MELINTDQVTWGQIHEIRSNQKLQKQLQNLRLFFHENYSGLPRAFIEDDLGRRLDKYEQARKTMGFETVTSTISILLDSNNIHSAVAVGVIAALLGGPITGVAAGTLVEIGKVSLEIAKRIYSLRNLRDGHELAYIINLQSKIG